MHAKEDRSAPTEIDPFRPLTCPTPIALALPATPPTLRHRCHRLPPLDATGTMDDGEAIPSIQTSGVGSRFVSQSEIDTAKARRDEQWKAAYARYVLSSKPSRLSLMNSAIDSVRNPLRNPSKMCLTAEAWPKYVSPPIAPVQDCGAEILINRILSFRNSRLTR